LRRIARRSPVADWGLSQAMHMFGSNRPSYALRTAKTFCTGDLSGRVRQDVLLLASARYHYVPLEQLWEQARGLTAARSITMRVFTAEEQAQAHCQVGNLPLAIDTISDWHRGISGVPAS